MKESITCCSILVTYVTNPRQIQDFSNILLNFFILYVCFNENINTTMQKMFMFYIDIRLVVSILFNSIKNISNNNDVR